MGDCNVTGRIALHLLWLSMLDLPSISPRLVFVSGSQAMACRNRRSVYHWSVLRVHNSYTTFVLFASTDRIALRQPCLLQMGRYTSVSVPALVKCSQSSLFRLHGDCRRYNSLTIIPYFSTPSNSLLSNRSAYTTPLPASLMQAPILPLVGRPERL